MSIWKDRGKELFETSSATIGGLTIKLHRHMDHEPSAWFVSCQLLGIVSTPLNALNLAVARREATKIVRRRLEQLETHLTAIEVRTPT